MKNRTLRPFATLRRALHTRRKSVWVLRLTALVVILGGAHLTNLDDSILREIADISTSRETKDASVWLNSYTADMHVQLQPDAVDEISGLTWSNTTKTLFAVMNKPTRIAELSREGELLRVIAMTGFQDIEAITWAGDDIFFIADERRQSVVQVEISSTTETLDYDTSPKIGVGIKAGKNKGFEGIAWQPDSASVWVAKERDPMTMYRIHGFSKDGLGTHIQIDQDSKLNEAVSWDNTDLSGLHFDERSGNILVLSDQSALLTEMTLEGNIVSSLELGLLSSARGGIRQPEGVTMDDKGDVYIVSEPNLLYRFTCSDKKEVEEKNTQTMAVVL